MSHNKTIKSSSSNNNSSPISDRLSLYSSNLESSTDKFTIYITNKQKQTRKFYQYLVPKEGRSVCLQNDKNFQSYKLLVSKEHRIGDDKKTFIYTGFRDVYEFYYWIKDESPEDLNYFEIIACDIQKPHFDIDINIKGIVNLNEIANLIVDFMRKSIKGVFTDFNVPYVEDEHLLVTSSHGPEKRSFHITIRDMYHENNLEAKGFYDLVLRNIPDYLKGYIDHSVYKKNQAFRMLYNQKLDSGRPKMINNLTIWSPNNSTNPDDYNKDGTIRPEIAFIRYLEESLISNYVNDHFLLPSFLPGEQQFIKNKYESEDSHAYYDDCRKAFYNSPFAKIYKIVDSNWKGINLQRIHSAYCIIHNRIHDNDGAYIIVTSFGNIMFVCRRGSERYKIGNVDFKRFEIEQSNQDNENNLSSNNELSENQLEPHEEFKFGAWNKEKVNEFYAGKNFKNNDSDGFQDKIKLESQNLAEAGNHFLDDTQNLSGENIANKSDELDYLNKSNVKNVTNDINNDIGQNVNLELSTFKDLKNFVSRHLSNKPGINTSINDCFDIYQKYCYINNLKCYYIDNTNGIFSKDLIKINEKLRPKQLTVNTIKSRYILNYELINTKNLTKDTKLNEEFKEEMKNELSVAEQIKQRYDRIQTRKLIGNHKIDMSEKLPDLEKMLGGLENYCFVFNAALGAGKTEGMRALINSDKKPYLDDIKVINATMMSMEEAISKVPKGKSFLAICPRISLALKQVEDFMLSIESKHNAKYYQDELNKTNMWIKNVRRLIVTIDSLYRVVGTYEYLILDEFTYSLFQLIKFSKNKRENIEALDTRLKITPKIIVADAFVDDNTINILKKVRIDKNDVIIYENHHPKHSEKTVNVFANKELMLKSIYNSIEQGKRIIIAHGSKNGANNLADKLRSDIVKIYKGDQLPTSDDKNKYKIKVYTSDEAIKVNPTKEWDLFDGIIYTSVIECGSSYTGLRFHKTYGIFTKSSFGPQSAGQMLFRSRAVIDNEINICVTGHHMSNRYPSTIKNLNQLKVYIMDKSEAARDELMNVIRLSSVSDKLDYNHIYFDMYCVIEYRELIGKRDYLWNLLELLKLQGVKFGKYIDSEYYMEVNQIDNKEYERQIKEVRAELREVEQFNNARSHESILNAELITYEQSVKLNLQTQLSLQEKYMLKKYNLLEQYKLSPMYPNKPILTPTFVKAVIDKKQSHNVTTLFKDLSAGINLLNSKRLKDIAIQYGAMEGVKAPNIGYDPHEITKSILDLQKENMPIGGTCIEKDDYKSNYITFNELIPNNSSNNENNDIFKEPVSTYDHIWQMILSKDEYKPDMTERVAKTERMFKFKQCVYVIKILRIYGFFFWLRTHIDEEKDHPPPFLTKTIFDKQTLEVVKFIKNNKNRDFEFLIPNKDILGIIEHLDNDNIPVVKLQKIRDEILSYINTLLKIFELKINTKTEKGKEKIYYLKQFWFRDVDDVIRPILQFEGVKLEIKSSFPIKEIPKPKLVIKRDLKIPVPNVTPLSSDELQDLVKEQLKVVHDKLVKGIEPPVTCIPILPPKIIPSKIIPDPVQSKLMGIVPRKLEVPIKREIPRPSINKIPVPKGLPMVEEVIIDKKKLKDDKLKNDIEQYYNLMFRSGELDLSELINLHNNILTADYFNGINPTKLKLNYSLIKEIPIEINNFTNLISLHLNNNKLVNLPNLEKLISLKDVNLSYNRLKYIPNELSSLTNLVTLNLSNNGIKEIPNNIENLLNLKELHLSVNQIQTLPLELFNLLNLEKLIVSDNKITVIPKLIYNLTKLKDYNAHGNKLDTGIFGLYQYSDIYYSRK